MRKTTKFLTLVLAVIMVASMFVTGTSAAFEDVDYTSAEGEAVGLLVSLGVAKGTTETKFGSADLVTRQQMAAFIYRLMKAGKMEPTSGPNTTSFIDIEDAYYNATISWASQTGIIKGVSDVKFNPKGNITLQDAYVMVIRALGYEADGALSYPFGYIEKAEDIGLDADLPSTVNYTDALTRGQVAIILKNAFYADMASYEIVYVSGEPKLVYKVGGLNGPASPDDEIVSAVAGTSRPENKYDTIATKIFGVEKITEYVVATPNYSFGEYEPTKDTDDDAVIIEFGDLAGFTAESDDETVNVDSYFVGTVEFDSLGLEGEADDYFMAGIELFIKKNDNGDKIILGANSLLNKKTVDGADVTIGLASGNTDAKYYDREKEFKRASGLLTIDGVKTYLYNAPYSYAKPEGFTKEAINAYNAQLLWMDAYTADVTVLEDDEAVEEVYNYGVGTPDWQYSADAADDLDENSDTFINIFHQAYFGGFYELVTLDVNGDGLVDFIEYKPYSIAIIDDSEDMSLVEEDFGADYKLYIDKSIIKGVEANDKDVVIAYVNAGANYAEIKAVVEGKEAKISNASNDFVKFSTGEKHEFGFAKDVDCEVATASFVLNNVGDLGLANADVLALGTEGMFYFYEGKLVYIDDVTTKFDINSDWVIVLDADVEEIKSMTGNKIETFNAVTIYHDGEIKSVKAKKITEDMRKYNDEGEATKYTASPETVNADDAFDFSDYVGKLATAKVDAKGAYYFELAEDKYEFAGAEILVDEDEDGEYMYEVEESYLLKHRNNIYKMENEEGGIDYAYVRDYTQIIIRSIDEDGDEIFTVFDSANLPDLAEDIVLQNVTVILGNNKSSKTYENLIVFYGEARDGDGNLVELESAKGKVVDYRVIMSHEATVDENDDTLYTYSVLNPFTGKRETAEGNACEDAITTRGAIYSILSTGKIDDIDDEYYGNIYTEGMIDTDTTKIADKKGALGYVEIEAYEEEAGELLITGDISLVKVTKDTKVYFSDKSDASFVEKTVADLGSTSKSLRQGDNKDALLRAFIVAEKNDTDSTDDEDAFDATIIIIVRD